MTPEQVIRSLHAQIRRLEKTVEALNRALTAQHQLLDLAAPGQHQAPPALGLDDVVAPDIEPVIAALKELGAL